MLGIVILLWVLAQFVVLIAAGFLDGDLDGDFGPLEGSLIIAGSLCSAPLVVLLLYIRRPKLEHLIIAEPVEGGKHVHFFQTQRFCKLRCQLEFDNLSFAQGILFGCQ